MEVVYERKRGRGCPLKKNTPRKMLRSSPEKTTPTKTTPTSPQPQVSPPKKQTTPKASDASPGLKHSASPSFRPHMGLKMLDWPVPTSPDRLAVMYKRAKEECTEIKNEVKNLLFRLMSSSNEQHVANLLLAEEPLFILYDMLLDMEDEQPLVGKVVEHDGSSKAKVVITLSDSTA